MPFFGEIVRRFLDRAGYDLNQKNSIWHPMRRLARAMQQLEDVCRGTFLSTLPPANPRRAELLAGLDGTSYPQAMCLIDWLHRCLPLPGDVLEMGVCYGSTSALLANEMRDTAKHLWLFDSFIGLPAPSQKDVLIDDVLELGSIEKYTGRMDAPRSSVESKLRAIEFPFERVHIVPGFVEQTLQTGPTPQAVCFAYLDMDYYEPTRVALNFMHDRLPRGACVIVDDYRHFSTGAQHAVDEFVAGHPGEYDFKPAPDFAGHFVTLQKL